MLDNICGLPTWQHIGIIILVQFCLGLVNLYMSKSDKTKANSIAEFVFNLIASILKRKH